MWAKPDFWWKWRIPALALVAILAVQGALAQEPDPNDDEEPAAPTWQPPDLADLPLDWWVRLDVISPAITRTRAERFAKSIQDRVYGLDSENLVAGQTALDNLTNVAELLAVTRQSSAGVEFDPIPTQSSYTLDDLLALRDQRNILAKDRVQTALEIDLTARKTQLLVERRDRLLRRYQAAEKESPERILTGLERVTARVEFELETLQNERLEAKLKSLEEQIELLEQQGDYARGLLDSSDAALENLQTELVQARSRTAITSEKMAALQKQLLDVVSADILNASLQLLRTQQLTRSSADASLAQLELAMAQAKLDWYLLRAGQLDPDFDHSLAVSRARRLSSEALEQLDVLSSASQSTLVASPPGTSANAMGNFQIAQSVARETLVLIEQIRDISDDLLFLRDILSAEIISAESGLTKIWSNISLVTSKFWERMEGVLDYNLFSMGDAPVTPGGIIKMMLILALAFGISWFIRHLLDRLGRRKQFANSPAIYTLGRLLHYLIITIGIFAALASIGLDFSNFALIAGALSVGIGFGLQAIVNNFVSGLILLFEGSLRVGDYIELDSGLAGVVKEINTRATIVNTNDAVDVVVPNSELVTTKLTNWTLRESVARIRIGFGVAYGTDKDTVRELALEAAKDMDFVIINMLGREPQVRLVNFGDNSLDFELLAWVSRQGVRRPNRVRASFLWALESRLHEAGIVIPFPQRDLHIKSEVDSKPGKSPISEKT